MIKQDMQVCPVHDLKCKEMEDFKEMIRKLGETKLGAKVFYWSMGIAVILIMSFAGWHVASLDKVDAKYEKIMEKWMLRSEDNRALLIELRSDLKAIRRDIREEARDEWRRTKEKSD